MKTNRRFRMLPLAASAFFLAMIAAAAAEEQPAEPLSRQELFALEQFLTLSDEQLDRIQAAIARVRAMPVEQRRAYAAEIVRFRTLPEDEQARIRDRWGWQSAGDRDDWRTMMQELSPAERQEIHEAMQGLDPAERTAFRLEILEKWRQQQ